MASLKEVATAASVSVATASHVVNGTRFVSPELTSRVRAALVALDYTPNLVARSLRTQRTHSLGFITADVTNPFYPAVAKGAAMAASQRGYHVILVDCDESLAIEEQATELLLQNRVDGLMYTSIAMDSLLPEKLHSKGIPYVLIGRHVENLPSLYVGIDNEQGMIEAVSHLARLGHRRIAFIQGNPLSSAAAARTRGFKAGLRLNHLPVEARLIRDGDYRQESGHRAGQYLMALENPPTALVASNDVMAFGAWRCFRQMGLRVPDDVSLVGCDDIPLASLSPVGLTTVHCPMYEMGFTAAEMLLDAVESKVIERTSVKLQVELIVRDTTCHVSA